MRAAGTAAMCIATDTNAADDCTPARGCNDACYERRRPALDPVLSGIARRIVARRGDNASTLEQLAERLRETDPRRHAALLMMLSGGSLG